MASKIKKIAKNVESIDLSLYVNIETGETMASEFIGDNKTMSIKEEEDTVGITSNNYAVIDTDTLTKLVGLLSNYDLGHLLKLVPLTKTDLNMIYNHTQPHSNKTLQEYLQISNRTQFTELMKRLVKVGVLYQIKGNINGCVRVVYIMNPFFSRKRKTFSKTLLDIFKQF